MSLLEGLQAEAPQWALAAGLPEPRDDETMADYLGRLGIDPAPLVEDLTEQTAALVSHRFEHYLRLRQPKAWFAHVDVYVSARIDPRRRKQLQLWTL